MCYSTYKGLNQEFEVWLDRYLMKPTVFQKVLPIQEGGILPVAKSIEKKKRTSNL